MQPLMIAAVAGATTTTTTTSLTELSLPQQQHQQHEFHDIQAVADFQDTYWIHQQTQQQQQQQQQENTTMPKVPHQSSETGRSRGGACGALPTTGQNFEDQENGNLSWLLDFKLDSFIEAPEDRSGVLLPKDLQGIL